MNSRQKWAAFMAASLVFFAFSSCAKKVTQNSESAPAADDPLPVSVRVVEESGFSVTGEYFGAVQPIVGATLIAPAGGRVEALRVRDGDRVKTGDSLGAVALEKAEAQYRTAVLNERIAGDSYRRQKEFFASGSAAKIAVDQAELAWNGAKSALLQAEEILRGARCESPLDGTVLSRKIALYDELPPGSPTFTVGDLSRLTVEIGIPEADIGGVSVGDTAILTFSAYPELEMSGTLSRIDRELSARTLTFRAEVVVDNPGERILPGVTAKVALPRRLAEKALVVPSESLLNASDGSYVMLARKEGTAWVARRAIVSTGPSDAGSTVIAGGLSRGDLLIIEGNHLAEDGAPVSFDDRLAMADLRTE